MVNSKEKLNGKFNIFIAINIICCLNTKECNEPNDSDDYDSIHNDESHETPIDDTQSNFYRQIV